MAASERTPEQTIRDWLHEHGPADVGIDAIEQTWELESLTAADRRRIGRALDEAGVICEPPLRRAGRRDRLHLSLTSEARSAAHKAEPEPEAPVPTLDEAPPAQEPRTPLKLAPLAFALMVVGALGPWTKGIFVVDYGLDRDGLLVIGLAVAAGLLLLAHARLKRARALPVATALVATAAVMVVASDFRAVLDDELLSPAWGLYVAFAGSAAMVALAMLALARR